MSLMLAEVPLIAYRLLGGAAFLIIFIGGPVAAIMMKRKGSRHLEKIVSEILDSTPATGPLVHVRFHTYHGLIAFVIQTTHDLELPLSHADPLIRRLNRFNLTWGLLAYGVLVIPLLSQIECRSQLRSIREQATESEVTLTDNAEGG